MYESKKETWFRDLKDTKVLIADDDKVDQAKLKKALALEGIDSILVNCAEDAIRVAFEDPGIDFVVTDLNMPWSEKNGPDGYYHEDYPGELGGVVVAKLLKDILPVLVYTSTETKELTAYCREGVFHGFIIKDARVATEAALRIMTERANTRSLYFKSQREKHHRDALNYRICVDTGKVFSEKMIEKTIIGYCNNKNEQLLPFTKNLYEALQKYDELISRLYAFKDASLRKELAEDVMEKIRRSEEKDKHISLADMIRKLDRNKDKEVIKEIAEGVMKKLSVPKDKKKK